SARGFYCELVSDDEQTEADLEESEKRPARRSTPKRESLETGDRPRKKTGVISRFFKSKKIEDDAVEPQVEETAATQTSDEPFSDAEARITGGRPHEEFATRRGGRRRRRPKSQQSAGEARGANGQDEEVEAQEPLAAEASEPIAEEPAEIDVAEETPAATSRNGRRPAPRSRRRPTRREHKQPAISDLLREGQEILVQIAKEPIAKKGARITSHIALPGRYLVYMPTVNHVGVSRKIPSDQERIRLKRIVSSLREREGGTGGFIARTACTGHT